jgi:nitrate reductase NapE component
MRSRPEPGSLRSTLRELREGSWSGNARARASRRKSPWNLLLILALPLWLVLLVGGLVASRAIAFLVTHGQPLARDLIWPSSLAPLLIYPPLLLTTIPLAMVLVNYFVYYCVPPARRAMDAEDRAFPGTEYAIQQPILLRITLTTFPVAFVLAVIGRLFL